MPWRVSPGCSRLQAFSDLPHILRKKTTSSQSFTSKKIVRRYVRRLCFNYKIKVLLVLKRFFCCRMHRPMGKYLTESAGPEFWKVAWLSLQRQDKRHKVATSNELGMKQTGICVSTQTGDTLCHPSQLVGTRTVAVEIVQEGTVGTV